MLHLRDFEAFLDDHAERDNARHHTLSERLTVSYSDDHDAMTLHTTQPVPKGDVVCYYAGSYLPLSSPNQPSNQWSKYVPTSLFAPGMLSGYVVEGESYHALVERANYTDVNMERPPSAPFAYSSPSPSSPSSSSTTRTSVGSSNLSCVPCLWAAGAYVATEEELAKTNVRIASSHNESLIQIVDGEVDAKPRLRWVEPYSIHTVGSRRTNAPGQWSYALMAMYATTDIQERTPLVAPAFLMHNRPRTSESIPTAPPSSPTRRALIFSGS